METSSQSDSVSPVDVSRTCGVAALTPLPPDHRFVARTERGLVVRGTRLTLYEIWERLVHGMDRAEIQAMFRLSTDQMSGVIDFIDKNRQAFEAEYQAVVARAEESRRYWETRNRDRLPHAGGTSPPSGKEEAFARLQARKAELSQK